MTLILHHTNGSSARIFTREDSEFHPGLVYVSIQPETRKSMYQWKAEAPLWHGWLPWPDVAQQIEHIIGTGWTSQKIEWRMAA